MKWFGADPTPTIEVVLMLDQCWRFADVATISSNVAVRFGSSWALLGIAASS